MEIKKVGSQSSGKGPPQYFTGTVRVRPVVRSARNPRASSARVSLSSRARARLGTPIR